MVGEGGRPAPDADVPRPGRTGHPLAWHHALDIDTEEDWEMGEFLLRYRATVADRAVSE